jgi:hypothetical protein
MSFSSKSFIAAAACVAAFGLAAGAFAQDNPPPPAGGPGGPAGAHAFADHMMERMRQHEAERTKALHDVLNIRPDQEAAFQAYTVALHPAHDGAKWRHGPRQGGPGDPAAAPPATTPEKLDRLVARLQERQQRMQARVTAIKTFYAVLSPEQQHTFDSLPLLRGGDRNGRGGPEGHGGWGPRA